MLKKFASDTTSGVMFRNRKSGADHGLNTMTMCGKCHAFYYKNAWHFENPIADGSEDNEVLIHFTQCVACLLEENTDFEVEPNIAPDINRYRYI